MTIRDIDQLIKKLNLSEEAIKQIENVRNSEPSRKVKSGGKNVPGFYPSKKMGVTIQFESHKLELAAIYEKEHDPNVIEYYDQPPSFPIKYDNPEGSKKKTNGHRYTADFFVIENNWIGWEEWKTDEELIKLSEKNPKRYCVDEKGNWRCPPCERHAEKYGLSFRVRSSKDIDWTYQRNIRFLEDFLLDEKMHIPDDASKIIKKLIGDKPFILLEELLYNQNSFTADDVYTMMVLNEIYVDIYKYLIVDFDKFPLFLNRETYKAYLNMQYAFNPMLLKPSTLDISVGNKIHWDARVLTIVNLGENVISLLDELGKIVDIPIIVFEDLISKGAIKEIEHLQENEEGKEVLHIIRTAGEIELENANRKYTVIQGILNGGKYSDYNISDRTIRDWMKKYRDAEKILGNGYVGLISARHRQGNRTERLEKEVIELMDSYIEDQYETIIQKKRNVIHRALKKECQKRGYSPPSYKTFCIRIKERPKHLQTKKMQGSRAAYKTEPFYFELEETTPRHGDRPFEICHIDHTELDITLICSQTEENLGKPWVTFLVDAYSRRILAFYLTFDPPSYRSNMMVLRECVRRHSRLPNMLVVDGGKDFQSVYFDTLLARYNIGKKIRPGAKPRLGSLCERLFGTLNSEFIHNCLGNTKIMKNVRQVTKEVNPDNHAVWTLEDLQLMLQEWCYDIYDNMPHTTLDVSPVEAFVKRIAKTGERKNTYIKYDETFIMLTLPTTRKGTAKVIPGQGVKINYFYYWSEILLHPENEEKNIPVRFDPFNVGIAYAYVNNYWVTLNSDNFMILENRTQKEIKLASEEIRKRNKLIGVKKEMSSAQIVEFLQSAEGYETLRKQQLKDNAVRNTFRVIDGGKIDSRCKTDKQQKRETTSKKENILKVTNSSTGKTQFKDMLNKMAEKSSFQVFKEL